MRECKENVEERSIPIVQVQDVVAVRSGEQILEVPGIGGIFMSSKDLAPSYYDRAKQQRPLRTGA